MPPSLFPFFWLLVLSLAAGGGRAEPRDPDGPGGLVEPAQALSLFALFSQATDDMIYTLDTEAEVRELASGPQAAVTGLNALLGQAAARLSEVASGLSAALSQFSPCKAYRGNRQSFSRTRFRKDAPLAAQLDWSSSSVVLPPGFEKAAPLEFLSLRSPLEEALLELAHFLPESESHFFVSATDGGVRALPGASVLHLGPKNALRSALASEDARFLPSFRAHMSFGRVLVLVDGSTYYTDEEKVLLRALATMTLRLLAPTNFIKLLFASSASLPFSDSFLRLDGQEEAMLRFIASFNFEERNLGRRMSTSALERALSYGLSRNAAAPAVELTIVISGGTFLDAPRGNDGPAALDTNLVFLQLPFQTRLVGRDADSARAMASRAADLVASYGGTYARLEAGQDASFFDFLSRHEGEYPLRTPGDIDCYLELGCRWDSYCAAPGFISPSNDLPRLPTGTETRDLVSYVSIIIDAISPFMESPRVRYTHSRGAWTDDGPVLIASVPVHARLRFRRLALVGVLATSVRPSPTLSRESLALFKDDDMVIWPEPQYCATADLTAQNARLDSRGHYSLIQLNAAVGNAVRMRKLLWGPSFRALVQGDGGICPSADVISVRTSSLPFDSGLTLALVTPVGESLFASLPGRLGLPLADLHPSDAYLPGGTQEGEARPGMLFFRVTESNVFGSPAPGVSGQCAAIAWAANLTCADLPHCPCASEGDWEPREDSPELSLGFYSALSIISRALAAVDITSEATEELEGALRWGLAVRATGVGLAVATYPLPVEGDSPGETGCRLKSGAGQGEPDSQTLAALQKTPAVCYVEFRTEVSVPSQGIDIPILTSTMEVRLDVLERQLGVPGENETLILLGASGVVLASRRWPGRLGEGEETMSGAGGHHLAGYTLLNHEDLVPLSLVLNSAGALILEPQLSVRFSALPPGRQKLPRGLEGELSLLEVVEGAALFRSRLSGPAVQPPSFSVGQGVSSAGGGSSEESVVPAIMARTALHAIGIPSRREQLAQHLSLRRTQYTPSVLRQVCEGSEGLVSVDYVVFVVSGLLFLGLTVYLAVRLRPSVGRSDQIHKRRLASQASLG